MAEYSAEATTTPTTTPTTVTAPAPPPTVWDDEVTGEASWYSEAPDGYCASPALAFGTVVTVTDLATGVSVTCTIDDREAHNPGRVVDMSEQGFSQLAPLSQGLIDVSVRW